MSIQTENNPLADPGTVRIRFGDGPAQDLPANLAEAVLRRLWAKSPAGFGAMLRQAMMDTWATPDGTNGHQNGHQS